MHPGFALIPLIRPNGLCGYHRHCDVLKSGESSITERQEASNFECVASSLLGSQSSSQM
ncbi:hypothetical protein PGTUg99_024192 [Puccinia graminis f. sp. tritici]|uniref:Uncharacterized protein n=1 Tax=Puccinia graminis f. sp. tritici TaxID=56615 RepID=A0A5B0REJ8_PUCGR|nr:hypothetical protein PGTUg99_024192 [Puccinia graminis f. sp. tritici]